MDKYLLEKFGLDKEEKILFEFKGKISIRKPKKYKFRVFKGPIYVTNHRIIAHGLGMFEIDKNIGMASKSPSKAFAAFLSEFKPCYGYPFPIKNLYDLIPLRESKNRALKYLVSKSLRSSIWIDNKPIEKRKIKITVLRNRDIRDELLTILNEFQTRE